MSVPAEDQRKTARAFRATILENAEAAHNHFCYIDGDGERVTILYRVRGKGTRLLTERAPGAVLDVVGPLGNAYTKPRRGTVPVVVAGGIGMASVFPHIRALRGKAVVLYGARSAEELLLLDEVERAAAAVHVSTLDGSLGTQGTVLDLMGGLGREGSYTLYVCGPHAMIEAVGSFAADRGLPGYASLEEFMACGVGACMGCVVKTVRGYERVCREGPVFRLEDIVF
jgi:dihydroorotate dehydrogenase electron transfer subunit